MKRVYIAGPIRAVGVTRNDEISRQENILEAEKWALEVAKTGAAVFVPHSQARFFQGSMPDDWWIAQDLEWLKVADAVLVVDTGAQDWDTSQGTMVEVNFCLNNNIPIFYASEFTDYKSWLLRSEVQV